MHTSVVKQKTYSPIKLRSQTQCSHMTRYNIVVTFCMQIVYNMYIPIFCTDAYVNAKQMGVYTDVLLMSVKEGMICYYLLLSHVFVCIKCHQ